MVKFLIADRRDLLGGRLIPILNGLRLAQRTGGQFLTTWFSADDPFQSLVADLPQILAGPFLPLYPDGYRIAVDDPRLASGSNKVLVLPCREAGRAEIGDFFVLPDLQRDIVILDRRFSLCAFDRTETFAGVRSELARIFQGMPKAAVIETAMSQLAKAMPNAHVAAMHGRRLHLSSDTGMQLNRFDSYHTTETYRLIGEELLAGADFLLVASDSTQLVTDLKASFPGRALSIDQLLDVSRLTGLQRAMMDMIFLSYGRPVVGALSAYGVAAAIIGDKDFINVTQFAAERGLLKGDQTRRIRFSIAAKAREADPSFSPKLASEALPAALVCRWSQVLVRYPHKKDTAVFLAVRAAARRLSEYSHASFFGDGDQFVTAAINVATSAERPEVVAALARIRQALIDRKPDSLVDDEPPADAVFDHVKLCMEIVAADCSNSLDARSRFPIAIDHAAALGLSARGLLLRLGNRLIEAGLLEEAVQVMRRAVAADEGYADSWYRLSRVLGQTHAAADMISAARRATELDPESAVYWDHLGAQLAAAGDVPQAIEACRRAVLIEPDHAAYAAHLDQIRKSAGV